MVVYLTLRHTDPQPNYFATSLPDLLIFPADTAAMLQQQAEELNTLAQHGWQLLAAVTERKEQP